MKSLKNYLVLFGLTVSLASPQAAHAGWFSDMTQTVTGWYSTAKTVITGSSFIQKGAAVIGAMGWIQYLQERNRSQQNEARLNTVIALAKAKENLLLDKSAQFTISLVNRLVTSEQAQQASQKQLENTTKQALEYKNQVADLQSVFNNLVNKASEENKILLKRNAELAEKYNELQLSAQAAEAKRLAKSQERITVLQTHSRALETSKTAKLPSVAAASNSTTNGAPQPAKSPLPDQIDKALQSLELQARNNDLRMAQNEKTQVVHQTQLRPETSWEFYTPAQRNEQEYGFVLIESLEEDLQKAQEKLKEYQQLNFNGFVPKEIKNDIAQLYQKAIDLKDQFHLKLRLKAENPYAELDESYTTNLKGLPITSEEVYSFLGISRGIDPSSVSCKQVLDIISKKDSRTIDLLEARFTEKGIETDQHKALIDHSFRQINWIFRGGEFAKRLFDAYLQGKDRVLQLKEQELSACPTFFENNQALHDQALEIKAEFDQINKKIIRSDQAFMTTFVPEIIQDQSLRLSTVPNPAATMIGQYALGTGTYIAPQITQ